MAVSLRAGVAGDDSDVGSKAWTVAACSASGPSDEGAAHASNDALTHIAATSVRTGANLRM